MAKEGGFNKISSGYFPLNIIQNWYFNFLNLNFELSPAVENVILIYLAKMFMEG